MDPEQSQCCENEPNILLFSFAEWGIEFYGPAVNLAFKELFSAAREEVSNDVNYKRDLVNQQVWIDRTCRGKLKNLPEQQSRSRKEKLIESPRLVSAIMLFDHENYHSILMNDYCNEAQRITRAELDVFETMFVHHDGFWTKSVVRFVRE